MPMKRATTLEGVTKPTKMTMRSSRSTLSALFAALVALGTSTTAATATATETMTMAMTSTATVEPHAPPSSPSLAPFKLWEADFRNSTDGFVYHDDQFQGTRQPDFANGPWYGGAIAVHLGGSDSGDMSGAWLKAVRLDQSASDVELTLRYDMTLESAFGGDGVEDDADEELLVMARVENQENGEEESSVVIDKLNREMEQNVTLNAYGMTTSTWKTRRISLGALDAGNYVISLGAYLRSKNSAQEEGLVIFDSVELAVKYNPSGIEDKARTSIANTSTKTAPKEQVSAKEQDPKPLANTINLDPTNFSFLGDAFYNTQNPNYAMGTVLPKSGGMLAVRLGGVDQAEIDDISGAWKRSFNVDRPLESARLVLRYQIQLPSSVGLDDYAQALVAVDGLDVLDTLYGSENRRAQTTGWNSISIDLGDLEQGAHDLYLGGYFSHKNARTKQATVVFHNMKLELRYAAPTADTPVEDWEAFRNRRKVAKLARSASRSGSMQQAPTEVDGSIPETVLNADFQRNPEGFRYRDDIFGTSQPKHAAGSYWMKGTGMLAVTLGGVENGESDIGDMSGGWERTFPVFQDGQGTLKLRYKMFVDNIETYSALAQATVSINGHEIRLATIRGTDASQSPSTGWKEAELDIGQLSKGAHKIVLGGVFRSDAPSNETVTVLFDDIEIEHR